MNNNQEIGLHVLSYNFISYILIMFSELNKCCVVFLFCRRENHFDKWIPEENPKDTTIRDCISKEVSSRVSCAEGKGNEMKSFRESLKEKLKNPDFKKEWDALDEEFRLIRQDLDAKSADSFSRKYAGKVRQGKMGSLSR